jgi:hypothetical protein
MEPTSADESAKKKVDSYLEFFLPMVLSMSFNQPKRFWEMNYSQQMERLYSATSVESQLVLSPSLL